MTITKVSQVIGIRLSFSSIGRIFHLGLAKKKKEFKRQYGKSYLGYYSDYVEDLKEIYKEKFIDEKYELKLYKLTHDIYNTKSSAKDEFVIGIEITDTSTDEFYEDEKNYIISLEKITEAFDKMKKWSVEKGIDSNIFMYTIHDDCMCCN